MSQKEFEPIFPVFERAKAIKAWGQGPVEGSCEHGIELSRFHKIFFLFDFLSGCTIGGSSRRAQLRE
jgi:hypothetical protein